MKDFKIRCSAIGKIMSNPKIKTELLSQTTKTYVDEWMKEQFFNRKKEFSNKYTQKGLIVEDNSIDIIADVLGYGMLVKNEKYYENDYLTGTPDIVLKNEIIDAKSSWDVFTFPFFDKELSNKDYNYQLQGYMALTGRKKAKVVYVLTDTPENLIEREARFYCIQNGYDELDLDIYKQFFEKMTYSDIDKKNRVKSFEVLRDDEVISNIEKRVLEIREYINQF